MPGRTWVIKVGSSLLTQNGRGLSLDFIGRLADDIAELKRSGIRVVLVSSGSVAEGMVRLGFQTRPESIHLLQAAAAVGQMGLIQAYESHFKRHRLITAQVLLTHADLRSRERYLNARSTLTSLLDLGVVPVVNENDTVVTDEIRLGDNDTLAGMVANLIEANTLVLLTDQEGLYSSDPRFGKADLIEEAFAGEARLDQVAGPGSKLGRGGMQTKISAARIAARSGAQTIITYGARDQVIRELAAGTLYGTLLKPDRAMLASRKQWLAGLPSRGRLQLDAGAAEVLRTRGRSLLPVGVRGADGSFTRGEVVSCIDESGFEVARGLVNYSAEETRLIMGRATSDIENILGFTNEEELIHRDNMVLSR
ncbi:MAG: glutamate 5-kinase [Proteobacteria bacterium]|jgi:glutamate 5-kinase|nr:glutamate 5-kinase [Pseudomonadota bacterium]